MLADEGVAGAVVRHFRAQGHDVLWIAEDAPSERDSVIADLAIAEVRILLTLDTDFGELAFRDRRPMPRAVILARLNPQTPAAQVELFQAVLAREDLEGHFFVVTPEGIRARALVQG